jgi:hypothetical protein
VEHDIDKHGQQIVMFGDYTVSRGAVKNFRATFTETQRIGGGRASITLGRSSEEIENLMRRSGLSKSQIEGAFFWLGLLS